MEKVTQTNAFYFQFYICENFSKIEPLIKIISKF